MDAANAVEAGYGMYQRPCTQQEASSMTFKPLTCQEGQSGGAVEGYCYNLCFNKTYKSPGFGLAFKNDDELGNFLRIIAMCEL